MRYVDTLKQIAAVFESLKTFTAVKTVYNGRMYICGNIFCQEGDTIVVERWHCHMGPTSVTVNGASTCVPYEWLVEAGAPARLKGYMPFPTQTWPQIIASVEEKPYV